MCTVLLWLFPPTLCFWESSTLNYIAVVHSSSLLCSVNTLWLYHFIYSFSCLWTFEFLFFTPQLQTMLLMKTVVYVFSKCMRIYMVILGVKLLWWGVHISVRKCQIVFLSGSTTIILPPTVYESFWCSTSSSTFRIVRLKF